jgi:hypothetical protein
MSMDTATNSSAGYVSFGDIARGRLGEQAQYMSRYVGGQLNKPDLSGGLRFLGDPADYHSLLIHEDDIEEFVSRVEAYRAERNRVFEPSVDLTDLDLTGLDTTGFDSGIEEGGI